VKLKKLEDQVVVITGATSGIGAGSFASLATALGYALLRRANAGTQEKEL
jgi:NADP-dependent 3-hydroxy acid dehydrogenase YdfG